MASFLSALANIGSQYAQGRTEGQEEKEKLAQAKTQTELAQGRLKLEQGQQELERQRLDQEKEASKWLKLTPGELLWNPKTGEFKRPEVPTVGDQSHDIVQKMAARLTPQNQAVFQDEFQAALQGNYGDFTKAFNEVRPFYNQLLEKENAARIAQENKQQAAQDKQEAAALKQRERFDPITTAQLGLPPDPKDNTKYPQGENDPRYIADREAYGKKAEEIATRIAGSKAGARAEATQQVKTQFMNTQERAQWEQLKTLEPMAAKLGKFIEDNKLEQNNDLLTLLGQYGRYGGYKVGFQQDPIHQELIKDAAAIQVMGAAPWVRLGRGKYTLELIEPHLPKPTDTPANMYDKVMWLQENVIADAKNALEGLTPPGQTAPYMGTAGATGPAAAPQGPPQGAMFTGRGPDGKLHYLDKNHQDLGPVPGQP